MVTAETQEYFRQEAARYRQLADEHRSRMEQAAAGSVEYHEAESRALLYNYLTHSSERWLAQTQPNTRRPNAGEPPETLGC